MTRLVMLLALLPLVVAVNKERLEQIRLLHDHDGIDTATVHVSYAHSPSSPRRLTKREASENLLPHRHDSLAVKVTLASTGRVLDLRLRPSRLQIQGALVKVVHEEGHVSEFRVHDRGCHYHGTFDGGEGAASVHFCDGVMVGAGHGKDVEYHFHSHKHRLPHELDDDDNDNDNDNNINDGSDDNSNSVNPEDPLGLRGGDGLDLYHTVVSWKSVSDGWRVDNDEEDAASNLTSTNDYMEIDEDVNEEEEEEEEDEKKEIIRRVRRQAMSTTTPSEGEEEETYDPAADIVLQVSADPTYDEPNQEFQAEQMPVVEMGIIVDEEFLRTNKYLYPTRQDIIHMLMIKYTGVQALYGNPEETGGLNMTIKVKLLYLWEKNPPDYKGSNVTLGQRLVAGRIMNTLDPMYLKTDVGAVFSIAAGAGNTVGVAFGTGACRKMYKTYASRKNSLTWNTEAHELGHTLGLSHNPVPCTNVTPPFNRGFMNTVVNRLPPCYATAILNRLKTKSLRCLYKEQVNVTHIPPQPLQRTFPVLVYGLNFYCQTQFRSDSVFAFQDNGKPCGDVACSVTDQSNPEYGLTLVSRAFEGLSCGPNGEICLKSTCKSPEGNTSIAVRDTVTGSSTWKRWGPWASKCSSACGFGVQISSRECRNRDRAEACLGPRHRARLCNTQSCPGDDLMEELDIRRDRANYTCSLFYARGGNRSQFLHPYTTNIPKKVLITPTNSKSCMVECAPAPRPPGTPKLPRMSFGTVMMADGTVCGPLSDFHRRVLGVTARCLRGRCLEFGCDGYSMEHRGEGKVLDMCGVCGGDNSTCTSGHVSVRLAKADAPQLLVELPAGTTDILFAVIPDSPGKASPATLALTDKDDSNVIVPGVWGRSRISTNVDNPLTFASTHWTVVNKAVLSAPGPTDQPMRVSVKMMQTPTPLEAVIVYGYKLPDTVPQPPECENGGVANVTNGGCMCSGRYHGRACEYGCHNLCYNGGQMLRRCQCDCTSNPRTVNSGACKCAPDFAGPGCSQCAIPQCFNGGTLDSETCQCRCPAKCREGRPDCSDCNYNPLLPQYRGQYGRGSLEDALSGEGAVTQRPTPSYNTVSTTVDSTSGGQAMTTTTTQRPVTTVIQVTGKPGNRKKGNNKGNKNKKKGGNKGKKKGRKNKDRKNKNRKNKDRKRGRKTRRKGLRNKGGNGPNKGRNQKKCRKRQRKRGLC